MNKSGVVNKSICLPHENENENVDAVEELGKNAGIVSVWKNQNVIKNIQFISWLGIYGGKKDDKRRSVGFINRI